MFQRLRSLFDLCETGSQVSDTGLVIMWFKIFICTIKARHGEIYTRTMKKFKKFHLTEIYSAKQICTLGSFCPC